MQRPKVSVVLVSYNHAKFLPKRIESILDQTFQDFELIILDDHSTDNSVEVIQTYPWNREYRFFPNSTNSGSPFSQWQRGLQHCTGEYVWIAESDDFASPEFLGAMVARLDSDPEMVICYSQSVGVDEQDNISDAHYYYWTNDLDEDLWRSSFVMDGKEFTKKYICQKCVIPNVSSAVFRRSALQRVAFPEAWMRHYGDWLIYARVAWLGKVGFVCQDYNFFRFHPKTQRANTSVNHYNEYAHAVHSIGVQCASSLTRKENLALAKRHYKSLRRMSSPGNPLRRQLNRARSLAAVLPFLLPF